MTPLPPPLLGMRPMVELTFTLFEDGHTISLQAQDFRGTHHPDDVQKILRAATRVLAGPPAESARPRPPALYPPHPEEIP